jgi:hypothetical protein
LTSKERLAVFVLDLTQYGSESKEYLLYAVHIIKELLKNMHENGIEMKILLLGFDTAVHRFVLGSEDITRHLSYGHHAEEDEAYFPEAELQMGHTIRNYQNIENALISL